MVRRAIVLVSLLIIGLACGGAVGESPSEESPSEEGPGDDAPAVEPAVVTIFCGPRLTKRFEVLDADLEAGRLVARLEYLADDADSDGAPECAYPGLSDPRAGVRLYRVDLEPGNKPLEWEVYRAPSHDDPSCTPHEQARTALDEFKRAIAADGLDPKKRLEPIPATGGEDEPRHIQRPSASARRIDLGDGHTVEIALTHESEAGYHTYTADVRIDGTSRLLYTHSPDPSAAGSGDIEVLGAIRQGDRVVVIFEESWGPAARWDDWVFTPALSLADLPTPPP